MEIFLVIKTNENAPFVYINLNVTVWMVRFIGTELTLFPSERFDIIRQKSYNKHDLYLGNNTWAPNYTTLSCVMPYKMDNPSLIDIEWKIFHLRKYVLKIAWHCMPKMLFRLSHFYEIYCWIEKKTPLTNIGDDNFYKYKYKCEFALWSNFVLKYSNVNGNDTINLLTSGSIFMSIKHYKYKWKYE